MNQERTKKELKIRIYIKAIPAAIFFLSGVVIQFAFQHQLLAAEAFLVSGLFVLMFFADGMAIREMNGKVTEYRSPSWEKNDSSLSKTITQIGIPLYVIGGILLMIWIAGRQ